MDITTLAVAVLVAFGLLATDAVLRSGSVTVQVAAPEYVFKRMIDERSLETVFSTRLEHIAATVSVAKAPEIRSSQAQGIGMTLAEAVNVKPLAFALQRQFGIIPDDLRFALFMEGGSLHGVVSGLSRATGAFTQEFDPEKDEKLVDFIERCATWGASQLAPYTTALYMLQHHRGGDDFREVVALSARTLATLPPGPVNEDRSQFENLLGLVQLFRNDPRKARRYFLAAAAASPESPVPVLNIAFTEIQLDENAAAAARMRALLASERSLLGSVSRTHLSVMAAAHMTLAAALMGLHEFDAAEKELQLALDSNPESLTAMELWAELKQVRGDVTGAERLNSLAGRSTTAAENVGELAALYFHLAWRGNEPVTPSRFSAPGVVTSQ